MILIQNMTLPLKTKGMNQRFRCQLAALAMLALVLGSGCQSDLSNPMNSSWFGRHTIDMAALNPPEAATRRNLTPDQRLDQLAGYQDAEGRAPQVQLAQSVQTSVQTDPSVLVRAQSPQEDDNSFRFPTGSSSLLGRGAGANPSSTGVRTADFNQAPVSGTQATQQEGVIRDGKLAKTQYPEYDTPDRAFIPGNRLSSPNVGSPNEISPLIQAVERGGNASFPLNYADLDVYIAETQTGRFNFGGAYNSDNGIVGQITLDEKNFDITRWPKSFREIADGTAFRGAGQQFRLELVPGANLERYLVSFTEPYLMGTDYSLSVSGYLFDRNYFDWDEQRLGGRVSIGKRLTPDISFNVGLRMESVTVDNARTDTSPTLNSFLGSSNLFLFNAGLVRDTRDSRVNATEGTFLSLSFSQSFGDYNFSRGDLDFRTYKLLYERPDGSGRHTVSFGTKVGFSGSDTPIFENYFAGGFSTLRGFDFRGAAPLENGVRIGGQFQWLNTLEYMFPITADDMVKGVVFCDFGTVEESVELNTENFRVAPGFGFRVAMPGAAGGAPLAFDFAFPVSTAFGDEEQVFSFYLGVLR